MSNRSLEFHSWSDEFSVKKLNQTLFFLKNEFLVCKIVKPKSCTELLHFQISSVQIYFRVT